MSDCKASPKASNEVYVAGVGMTRFTPMPERSLEAIGREAVRAALSDAQTVRADVDEMFCASTEVAPGIGQRVLRELGLSGIPVTNVDNGGAGGGTAIRAAVNAIRAGRCNIALVLGIDQPSRRGVTTSHLELDLEAGHGMTAVAFHAMVARCYSEAIGLTREQLADVVVKARAAGANNPQAHQNGTLTIAAVLSSPMIADPLTRLMCSPSADGAAAAVLMSADRARKERKDHVRIAASALQSGQYKPTGHDLSFDELTQRTSRLAYAQAGLSPSDIDIAEIDDAFAISALMACEALGLCGRGEAAALMTTSRAGTDSKVSINPSGGLLSRGHPPGATGLAQLYEATLQLRGEAGARQRSGARVALTHALADPIGGLGHGACAINILVT